MMNTRYKAVSACLVSGLMSLVLAGSSSAADSPPQIVDLSLLVATDMPRTWPANHWPLVPFVPYRRIGPTSAYSSEIITMDGNTGTQLDVPPHSVAPPGSGLPSAGPFGSMYTEKVPAWQFGGEACVVDCRDLLDSAPKGRSDLIKKERIM